LPEPQRQAVWDTMIERAADADGFIAVSHYYKDVMCNRLRIPCEQVHVVYNGIDIESFQNISRQEKLIVQEKYGLVENFLLSVGHFEKRKNYVRLIDALKALHNKGHLVHLVIVGNNSGTKSAVQERVNSLKLSGYVKMLEGLTDEEVRCVYSLCKLFVFPSTYEGFGIPILEAMAAKRPIVSSDIPVFQEITQGQGAYFYSDDADSVASTIERVLLSNQERKRLVQYGEVRIGDFSFRNIALDLARVYQTLS